MELTDIYRTGEAALRDRDIGWLLNGVETEFVLTNNRQVLDRYTIRQQCIDGVEPETACTVLGGGVEDAHYHVLHDHADPRDC